MRINIIRRAADAARRIQNSERRVVMKTLTYYMIAVLLVTLTWGFAARSAMAADPMAGSCDGIKLCTSIEGKDFEMIKFASMGSELIILYDKNKSGEISPTLMESLYDRSSGTVNDAIFYLSQNPDYERFIIRKASKSAGWFKAEDVDSVYLLLPKYTQGEIEAPEYSFFEKEGQLRVRIIGQTRMNN